MAGKFIVETVDDEGNRQWWGGSKFTSKLSEALAYEDAGAAWDKVENLQECMSGTKVDNLTVVDMHPASS